MIDGNKIALTLDRDGTKSEMNSDFDRSGNASSATQDDDVEPSMSSSDGFVFVGFHSHYFSCLSALDGSLIWTYMLPDRVDSSAALSRLVILDSISFKKIGEFSQHLTGNQEY